ncbi:hypothetical protein Pmani_008924 [Petrolisthes manimaculis]|uniref:Uncharacterized protein n=1 Tax=Petrolisthes manimaculis TaxID=1843537 RepID=A0AAE1Q4P7_9EUCA|nr:hypothetical protein Pmani_008924 [Petrolisthes manimaculis]
MERLLRLWIDDQTRSSMPLSTSLACAKALSIYGDLEKKGYEVKEGSMFTATWKEVTENTLNSTWKKLWPECVKTGFDFTGFDDMGTIRKNIVRLFHLAGFKEVDEDDVQELLQSHSEPLSNEDLMQLDQHRALQGDNDDDDDNAPQRGLDIKTLREIYTTIDETLDKVKERDPNPARSAAFAHSVEEALKVYKAILHDKTQLAKQSKISSFFKPVSQASPSTSAGPASRAAPSTSADEDCDSPPSPHSVHLSCSDSPTSDDK